MITFKNLREIVYVPMNGQLVQMKRIKIIQIERNYEYGTRTPNYGLGFPDRMFKLPTDNYPTTFSSKWPMIAQNRRLKRLRPLKRVVCDHAGHLYEQVDGKPRSLGEVVIDDHNRLYEIISEKLPSQNLPPSNVTCETDDHIKERTEPNQSSVFQSHRQTNNKKQPNQRILAAYEKIFADPGLHLQVAFGPMEEELSIYLAQPERLKPEDTLECYLQLYQLRRPVPRQHLAATELGDARYGWMFRPLTQPKAEALGVPELFIGEDVQKELARDNPPITSQRLYFITPVFDPTMENAKKGTQGVRPKAPEYGNSDGSKPL